VTPSVAQTVTRRTGVPWVPAYGASELPVITCNPVRGTRLDSAGKPVPGVELRVVSLETGRPAAAGETGEIQLRAPSLMAGYLPAQETAASYAVVHHRGLSRDPRQPNRREDHMTVLRVVQWATGNIGARSLRGVIQHPELTVAGVYVTSAAKAGKDAGDLCGLPAIGVTGTNDVDEILALKADCVRYMPAACDVDEVCALLASGANVVTTRGEFHRQDSIDPAVRARVEAACQAGGTSIHSTGSSPGFISEALPIALASIQRRLDSLTINEFADLG
jgi:acyl-CoA synthetase (AMP-forming)/AMP-acid ligase II